MWAFLVKLYMHITKLYASIFEINLRNNILFLKKPPKFTDDVSCAVAYYL